MFLKTPFNSHIGQDESQILKCRVLFVNRTSFHFILQSENKTCHEENFAEAVASVCRLSSPDQLLAIGLNCTRPQYITPLLKTALQARGDRLFIVNPKG